MTPDRMAALLKAADRIQGVFRGDPESFACFHHYTEEGDEGFCGKRKSWHNLGTHPFVSLADLLRQVAGLKDATPGQLEERP